MAKKFTIKISDISGGWSPYSHLSGANQYHGSVGIDPDVPVDNGSSKRKGGGVISPSSYKKFSGAGVSGAPLWIITQPVNGTIYTYNADGEFISYSATFASETVNPGGTAITSGAGNGAAYYNNYIYFATPTDVSRYGPLDNSPVMTNTFWTSTLSLAALKNETYLVGGSDVSYPNHPMHVHVDGALYFGDFYNIATVAATANKGLIHKIKTTSDGTDEGKNNDGSAYNVLDLPFGFRPMDIESYGEDLVVAAVQTTNATIKQGESALFFWDTFSDSFYRQVPIKESVVSALKNVNGKLYIFSGDNNSSVVSIYNGGYSVQPVAFLDEGYSAYAGAVDYNGTRVSWGGKTSFPAVTASIFSLGSKNPRLPANALHNTANSTSSGTSQAVTACGYIQQSSGSLPRMVIGWDDSTGSGLDNFSSTPTAFNSVFRSQMYNIGQKFRISKIRIPLSAAVAAGMSITPKIYIDDAVTTFTLKAITNANYSGQKFIEYKGDELRQNAGGRVGGDNNFELEFTFAGTVHNSVTLPITIEVELIED